MLLCAAQYTVLFGDKSANMTVCERLCAAAKEKGADIIVFPELSLTGFSLEPEFAEPADGSTVAFFCGLAVRYGLACVFGYAEKRGDKLFNVLAAVDESGTVIARYAKIHPFSFGGEDEVFSAGEELSVFRFRDVDIGLSICYDLRFPELYSALSQRCDCIIVSANWGAARTEHWLALLKARSIETQCFVVGCNCLCYEGMRCGGESAVYSPDGEERARAHDEETLIFADISAEYVDEIRCAFPQRNDRRSDIYRNFYE